MGMCNFYKVNIAVPFFKGEKSFWSKLITQRGSLDDATKGF
jgi:hypothetical protein